MLRLALYISFWVTLFVLAGCGGIVSDAPTSTTKTSSPGASSEPSTTHPSSPSAAPTGTTKPGPMPSGPISLCGILEGDAEANLAAFGRARALAIYEVVSVDEECSGAGGVHVTLKRKVGCSDVASVHFGNHACHSKDAWAVGDRAVVGVLPESGNVDNQTGWCLEGVAPWSGVARSIRKLDASESDASVLARYSCTP